MTEDNYRLTDEQQETFEKLSNSMFCADGITDEDHMDAILGAMQRVAAAIQAAEAFDGDLPGW